MENYCVFNFQNYPAEPTPNLHDSTLGGGGLHLGKARYTNKHPYISNMRLFLSC